MYGVKISNLVHTYFNINVTSEENQLLTPRFAEMLTLKYRPLQNRFNSSLRTMDIRLQLGLRTCYSSS